MGRRYPKKITLSSRRRSRRQKAMQQWDSRRAALALKANEQIRLELEGRSRTALDPKTNGDQSVQPNKEANIDIKKQVQDSEIPFEESIATIKVKLEDELFETQGDFR